MLGVLEELYQQRTDNDRNGTGSSEWNRVLLWRDLQRLATEGLVAPAEAPEHAESDFRDRTYFGDLGTDEIHVFVAGWERESPEFRKQA